MTKKVKVTVAMLRKEAKRVFGPHAGVRASVRLYAWADDGQRRGVSVYTLYDDERRKMLLACLKALPAFKEAK